jgi:hypothetical protein
MSVRPLFSVACLPIGLKPLIVSDVAFWTFEQRLKARRLVARPIVRIVRAGKLLIFFLFKAITIYGFANRGQGSPWESMLS